MFAFWCLSRDAQLVSGRLPGSRFGFLKKVVKHFNILITGQVQGVWYRASAQRKASELGLRGFVKNMPNGSVYAEAEGPAESLQAFVNWCHRGPELARVEKVEAREGPLQHFEGFEVRR